MPGTEDPEFAFSTRGVHGPFPAVAKSPGALFGQVEDGQGFDERLRRQEAFARSEFAHRRERFRRQGLLDAKSPDRRTP